MAAGLNACQPVFERVSFCTSFKSSAVKLAYELHLQSYNNRRASSGVIWEGILCSGSAKFQRRIVVPGKNAGVVLVKSFCAEYPGLDNAHCRGTIAVYLRIQIQKPLGNPRGCLSRQREAQNH
jgi:hypothetical protein